MLEDVEHSELEPSVGGVVTCRCRLPQRLVRFDLVARAKQMEAHDGTA